MLHSLGLQINNVLHPNKSWFQIFYFRPQTVYVSQLFLQVIAFILGKAWAKILPKASRGRFWAFLNPCDFTLKEHVAIG